MFINKINYFIYYYYQMYSLEVKKIIIKIYELFNGDVYEVKLVDHKSEKEYSDFYKYSFRTKNDIEYRISFFIKKDGTAKLDFMTEGKDPKHNSFIQLINTGDAIKVFNELKKKYNWQSDHETVNGFFEIIKNLQ